MSTPTPTPARVTDPEGDALFAALGAIQAALAAHTFPALTVETYIDPFDSEDEHQGLACPRCGAQDISPDRIAAVDTAERWTYADEIGEGAISLFGDDGPEWSDTLYYLHNDTCVVSLPEGWEEVWG